MMVAQFAAKRFYVGIILVIALVASTATAETQTLKSPNGKIAVTVTADDAINYAVSLNSKPVLKPSAISMTIEGKGKLGAEPVLLNVERRTVNQTVKPAVRQKSSEIVENFNEMILRFKGDYGLVFRAYDDGVGYRFVTNISKDITVVAEQVEFNFSPDDMSYFPKEISIISHNERLYEHRQMDSIAPDELCSLPVLVEVKGGPKVLISETDLADYPGLWLNGSGKGTFTGTQAKYVLKEKMNGDRNSVVQERADYLARTAGSRSFPWRFMIIAQKDGDLIESQMTFKLSEPSRIKDTSWIKPGKVAWDWYNANNIFGVDFRAGVNTETYKYYIDFASKYGIEYIILDEGWYELGDLTKIADGMDIEELFRYGKEKNVRIIPWVVWKTLDDQLDVAMDMFEKWGAAGLKVDFMQRDDQWMVNYYHRIAKACADRKMLVDFHGCYKPAGLHRTYPNVITREGVKGLENNKWGADITPELNVTMPFIRMAAGPIDFTPGSMVNTQKKHFSPVFNRPMSLGTRCHQLAMYVVYESPLQMLCENPSLYLREPECMEFLSAVPSVWDETKVLDAKVGDYISVARRNGDNWYVGAMTDWDARDMMIDFSFLGKGRFTIDIYKDGINADQYATDFKLTSTTVTSKDKMTVKLAPGGGWAAMISPLK